MRGGDSVRGREEAYLLVMRSLLNQVENRVGESGVGERESLGVGSSCTQSNTVNSRKVKKKIVRKSSPIEFKCVRVDVVGLELTLGSRLEIPWKN